MQVNSISKNNVNPNFGAANISKPARTILRQSIKDCPVANKKLRFATDYSKRNQKVDVEIRVNDDNKTLFAYFIDNSTQKVIKIRTENFLTRLLEGPVDFVTKMIRQADKMADKMN
jgi:hypothetical protein